MQLTQRNSTIEVSQTKMASPSPDKERNSHATSNRCFDRHQGHRESWGILGSRCHQRPFLNPVCVCVRARVCVCVFVWRGLSLACRGLDSWALKVFAGLIFTPDIPVIIMCKHMLTIRCLKGHHILPNPGSTQLVPHTRRCQMRVYDNQHREFYSFVFAQRMFQIKQNPSPRT